MFSVTHRKQVSVTAWTTRSAVWSLVNCHKKCSKCGLFIHGRRRACHWVTAALVTCGQIWTIPPRIAQQGGRRHGFTRGRRAPAACPILHSPPAWDRAVWRQLQRWYEIRSITTQHLDSLFTGTTSGRCWPQSQLHGTHANGKVNLWRPYISMMVAFIFTKIGNFVKKSTYIHAFIF